MDFGSLDTQDLLVWRESSKENMWDETGRIERLCEWAVDLGVDALISLFLSFDPLLQNTHRMTSKAGLVTFETMHAGFWHNYFPGETRIQLDLSRLISFYDTQLVPSLVPIRVGQERWDHRVGNISRYDRSIVKSKLEADLTSPPIRSSGIDWQSLLHVLVDRFADRLELTHYLLTFPAAEPADIINFANKTQIQLRTMLAPYLLLPAAPSDPTDEAALDWTVPMYKSCATSHASFTESELDGMTESEAFVLRAVRGTNREICRVLTKMWAAGVYTGIDIKQNTKEVLDAVEINCLQSTWLDDLNGLMGWLDWSVRVKCDPGCSPELMNNRQEMCFLPTWPFGFPLEGFPVTGLPYEVVITPDPNKWVRSHPRCIPRFEPFAF
ncbi:hypothetical protein JVU11DRAFT_11561 [Chiua virens]|nr:hypothetical protein JVU11DRAFT_11561 [Chiua virens]